MSIEELANTPAGRIAQHALLVYDGELEQVDEWLKKLGHTTRMEGETLIVHSTNGITSGICTGTDPITAVVSLLFVTLGQLWPVTDVGMDAFGIVKKEWKRRHQVAKRKRTENDRENN